MSFKKLKTIFLLVCVVVVIAAIFIFLHKTNVPVNLNQVAAEKIHSLFDESQGATSTNKTVTKPDHSTDALLKGMKLTFDDEFNNLNLYVGQNGNTTCDPGGKGTWQTVLYFCSRTIYTNDEAEVYTDKTFLDYYNKKSTTTLSSVSPFSINNGVLAIQAAPADPFITKEVGPWAKYTSGLLTTQYSFSQTYGYFEIRAKLPAGKGLWPAFWLLPVDKTWPPEIDALESFGAINAKNEGSLNMIHYASHTTNTNESCGAWHDVGVDITKDFHTYGVDWEPTGITYYFDGQPYVTCHPNPQANKPFYILVNLAVGGNGSWPGSPDASNVWPATMYVDYIRAYQKIN